MESTNTIEQLKCLKNGIPDELPEHPGIGDAPHAPSRDPGLRKSEQILAVKNALRYFPQKHHEFLAKEFKQELLDYGHIYMYRFRPTSYQMKAYPVEYYPCKSQQCASFIHMTMNNLNPTVAQHPNELITYGGNGSVFCNWAQYLLTMKYLCEMTEEQTLVLNSGHPQGLFPSHSNAPRVVISNGMMIPNYSGLDEYEKFYAMGNTMYGEMTAGSMCYIGSQGIVHGTTLTLLNMARKYYKTDDMTGITYVTSGLGGMSGAQGKAGDICKCITVVAEIDETALDKRLKQGWIKQKMTKLEDVVTAIRKAKSEKSTTSIAYLGNIVDLWEYLASVEDLTIELGSDQTSLHNPFLGGYYPVQLTLDESKQMMRKDPKKFKELVHESLRRQVDAIAKIVKRGMRFWDYGNAFLFQAAQANADVYVDVNDKSKFKYTTYFQEFMDGIFGLGFGPQRWICTSGDHEDLKKTDKIAEKVMVRIAENVPEWLKGPYSDNIRWIQQAESQQMVIGSEARILYADTQSRVEIALAFNEAIQRGEINGTIVISRDHHDVSGTDSPERETSAIEDGSKYTADMAIQNVIGDAMRGATWTAIHNGGGTGWGLAINGGFGLVLDGSEAAGQRAKSMLQWDVNNGVSRRAWSGNPEANLNIKRQMELNPLLKATVPNICDTQLLENLFE